MNLTDITLASAGSDSGAATCRYCGEALETYEADLFGKHYSFPCFGSCGCERSRRESEPPMRAETYARAGIGSVYQSLRVPCSEYVEAVRNGRNVFITGPHGSGKSTLAASIAMELCDSGVGVRFVNAAIVAQTIKDGFSRGGSDAAERMAGAPVLVLDDLGAGRPSAWEASLWYGIIEARNADRLPTVVASNYDGSVLISRLAAGGDNSTAQAIVSRLRGGAMCARLDGLDMRLGGVG